MSSRSTVRHLVDWIIDLFYGKYLKPGAWPVPKLKQPSLSLFRLLYKIRHSLKIAEQYLVVRLNNGKYVSLDMPSGGYFEVDTPQSASKFTSQERAEGVCMLFEDEGGTIETVYIK